MSDGWWCRGEPEPVPGARGDQERSDTRVASVFSIDPGL